MTDVNNPVMNFGKFETYDGATKISNNWLVGKQPADPNMDQAQRFTVIIPGGLVLPANFSSKHLSVKMDIRNVTDNLHARVRCVYQPPAEVTYLDGSPVPAALMGTSNVESDQFELTY